MNKEAKTEVKVGVTIFAAVLLFLIVIMWAKNFSFNSDYQTVTVKFPNISGLHIKDNVSVNGVVKGYVDDIKVAGNGVLVKMIFTSPVDLRKDASFSIVMLDLMGGKKVEVTPGISADKLDLSRVRSGRFLGDISTTMAMMTNVESDLVDIIHETKSAMKSLNELLGEENFSGKLQKTFDEVNSTMLFVREAIDNNKADVAKLIANSSDLSDSLNAFWRKNNGALLDAVKSSASSMASADSLMKKISALIDETKSQKNNAGKFLYDKELADKLIKALTRLNELTEIVNKQLKNEGLNVKTHIF